MDEPYTIAEAPLGYPFTPHQLERDCRAVIGSVAWPAKRPGCAVVLAVTGDKKLTRPMLYLLAEAQSDDLNELVRQCHRMDGMYLPCRWVGDNENIAAVQIMRELAQEMEPQMPGIGAGEPRRAFRAVYPTPLLQWEGVYAYLLPLLKRLLHPETRQLWLKSSAVLSDLGQIKPDEIVALKLGEYPGIEALGFAAKEALDWLLRAQSRRADPRDAVRERIRNHPMAF